MNLPMRVSRSAPIYAAFALMFSLSSPSHAQNNLPESMQVSAGNKITQDSVGSGLITYECREKTDAAGEFVWTFAGPDAVLKDRKGNTVGKYYGPPATWEGSDGSKVTDTQLAVAPNGSGNIALQLVKANPDSSKGDMQGSDQVHSIALNHRQYQPYKLPCQRQRQPGPSPLL